MSPSLRVAATAQRTGRLSRRARRSRRPWGASTTRHHRPAGHASAGDRSHRAGLASSDADFTSFVAARSAALYRSAWLLTTDACAAEDLVQSALAKAYVHWRKVTAADDPAAYVHGIVLKTFLSNRRRRSSGEIPVDTTPDRSSTDRDPTERLVLMAALRTLPPLDRAVVVLRYWEDHSVEDTARELHLSPAAVKNRSMRALVRLRQTLTDPGLHELADTKACHDTH